MNKMFPKPIRKNFFYLFVAYPFLMREEVMHDRRTEVRFNENNILIECKCRNGTRGVRANAGKFFQLRNKVQPCYKVEPCFCAGSWL